MPDAAATPGRDGAPTAGPDGAPIARPDGAPIVRPDGATPWSAASAGLSLPLRLAWILAREDGRPPVEIGGPGPLLLGAAVLQLLHDGALRRQGGAYVRGDADAGDPFEAWVREALLAVPASAASSADADTSRRAGRRRRQEDGAPGIDPDGTTDAGDRQLEDLAAEVAGRAGHRATEVLEELGLLSLVPRKIVGVPLGSHLRVVDPEALIRDRGLVRAVLDGQESHDVVMGALIAYLHHGGLVAHLEPEDLHAAETRAARIAGEATDGAPSPQGPVADAVRRTVEAMHVVLVPVGAVQIVTTNAHHRR